MDGCGHKPQRAEAIEQAIGETAAKARKLLLDKHGNTKQREYYLTLLTLH